jgi:hypothetical protein
MSYPDNTVTLTDVFAIEEGFIRSLKRLNLDGYKVSVDGAEFPLEAATHPYVFLPRLALRAEELAVLVCGVRLFPSMVYTVKTDMASGFVMTESNRLVGEQMDDPNALRTLAIPVADESTLTYGLQGMLFDQAITQCFDIDAENKLLKSKDLNLTVHKTFKQTVNYTDGQCIPLLTADYLAINELHGLAGKEGPLRALNMARLKAEELNRLIAQRREHDNEPEMSSGV